MADRSKIVDLTVVREGRDWQRRHDAHIEMAAEALTDQLLLDLNHRLTADELIQLREKWAETIKSRLEVWL
jgi:hypothetical protein